MALAAYFIESGLVLVVAPWSGFWDRNLFASYMPALQPLLASPYVRGGVSGIGAITALAGLAELGGVFTPRRSTGPGPSAGLEP